MKCWLPALVALWVFTHAAAAGDGMRLAVKKGACLTVKTGNWRAKVAALNVAWHYSWGAEIPEAMPAEVEFVPMVWGCPPVSERLNVAIDRLSVAKSAGTAKHLLGFNEPDSRSQSNVPVARALDAWPRLMMTGLRLGSPAPVRIDGPWMREFMDGAKQRDCRVDFVCVHWYGGPNVEALVKRLKAAHEMFGRPLWITEFAVADWQAATREENRHTSECVRSFMEEVLPVLDGLDFVERYAWFSAAEGHRALGPSALFKDDGSLTELGRVYARHATAGKAR